ncbi:endoglucanase [Neptunitalea chrysea]|uniref:Endoglucanase n=1 Tax=Neptunitalea chrysea TaxID=1647581 RepID=A0A9W6B475_9FLAO|nr:SGNH/GDSL hydrolase family protein [Neptunitalea chrysea]GLB51285.1 endoglucanase [Neptunitalea chrysea]
MKPLKGLIYLILVTLFHVNILTAQTKIHKPTNDTFFTYNGRINLENDAVALIGSASSTTFKVKDNSITLHLTTDGTTPYNFVVITVNEENPKRYKILAEQDNEIALKLKRKKSKITIYKATEASIGDVYFTGVDAKKLLPVKSKKYDYKIEFIGNSITCGMDADTREIPCDTENWYDQHNAYFAYGSTLSRALNAKYLLSSVSGIGIYRNWNDENIEEPIMLQVYDNLYLNLEKKKPYDYSFNPDLISICLGTNDLSDGDGIKERLPFNEKKYIANYITLVTKLYEHNPTSKIVLLNSPMVSGEKNDVLVSCLTEVKNHFEKEDRKIYIVLMHGITPKGCSFHPAIEEHQQMANQLLPSFKKILSEK